MALGDVIGHERAVALLRRALETGRVASAYLFAGEQAIGKRFTALNFAKALNCRVGCDSMGSATPCASCRKMDSGAHPDLFMVSPEKGVIKVGEIRRIEEALSLRPYEGVAKVVIVDSAEAMNQEAANAFLKTLEEPPEHSVIILITSSPDGLLETMRSRCVRINFKPLSDPDCGAVIRKHGGLKAGISAAAVRLSMGRPGLALDEDIVKERDKFIESFEEVLRPGNKPLWKDRAEIERWLDMSFGLLRDMAVFKITSDASGLLNRDISDRIGRMCAGTDLKGIIECYERLLRVREHLRFNLNKTITWNYVGSVLRGL
ncbi:MAG: DNA polymerase III subunit delta' [Thermodesulfovibrionales bacterium]|nr:DNA polymerase III subunit delta' [Thermodesulfovibrionales bacterium]